MVLYYTAKEISEKLEDQLKICKWERVKDGEAFWIELPVVLDFNYQRLTLYIYPVDDGYIISDDGQTFYEHSFDTEHYISLFNKEDGENHHGIGIDGDFIKKKYDYDYSLLCAIDEFIRFFIRLDDFMNKNDLT